LRTRGISVFGGWVRFMGFRFRSLFSSGGTTTLNIPAEAPPDEILAEQAAAASQTTAEETAADDALLKQFLAENFLAETPSPADSAPDIAPDIAPDFSSILASPASEEVLSEPPPDVAPCHASLRLSKPSQPRRPIPSLTSSMHLSFSKPSNESSNPRTKS